MNTQLEQDAQVELARKRSEADEWVYRLASAARRLSEMTPYHRAVDMGSSIAAVEDGLAALPLLIPTLLCLAELDRGAAPSELADRLRKIASGAREILEVAGGALHAVEPSPTSAAQTDHLSI